MKKEQKNLVTNALSKSDEEAHIRELGRRLYKSENPIELLNELFVVIKRAGYEEGFLEAQALNDASTLH